MLSEIIVLRSGPELTPRTRHMRALVYLRTLGHKRSTGMAYLSIPTSRTCLDKFAAPLAAEGRNGTMH